MTKQQKQIAKRAMLHAKAGNIGSAAKGMSALIRAASNQKIAQELLVIAATVPAVTNHHDFII